MYHLQLHEVECEQDIIGGVEILDESVTFRWSNEASAALEELEKTTNALQEISGNVKCLVSPAFSLHPPYILAQLTNTYTCIRCCLCM